MKIDHLKVFQSIKIGNTEEMFLKSDKYDMTVMEHGLIQIVDKKGNVVYTSLQNTPWFTELSDSQNQETQVDEQVKGNSNTTRASKKKGKSA